MCELHEDHGNMKQKDKTLPTIFKQNCNFFKCPTVKFFKKSTRKLKKKKKRIKTPKRKEGKISLKSTCVN